MATITVQPILLTNIDLKIAADNYEAAVSKVQFDPTSSIVKWKGLTPASVFNFSTSADWTVTLEFAQDWSTPNSLGQYLLANAGKQVTVTFKPQKPATGTSPTWTATVIIAPGAIGGSVDTVASASVTLAVVGVPALTVA
ncbi:hypothetical protein DBR36_01520 [Microbacterium sp. HMWF026]|uniref:hypothetical protein n=1 Tax=Microbacterium sp. HMWF026 TaxID=2056861 RepID=UPI000D3BE6F0|nr:hypothetical protein [Microbacterium sp. HMWF026]PTT22614.1 hypothetical protein DBR36_01520 [Microbacterium sp. HMWF026]